MWDAKKVNSTVQTPEEILSSAKKCKTCGFQISEIYFYCPNCGRKLKNAPQSLSITRQIYVYLISLFLPPLGLWPAIRYLFDKRPKAKLIGVIAIVLTIISIFLTFKITTDFLNAQKQIANQQLNLLEGGLGY